MSITTYTELRTAVASWAHRDDTAFTDLVPDFIRLLEARLNRELRLRDMEETLASTSLSSGAATLPAGFLAFKELRFDGSVDYTLQPKSLEWIRAQDNTDTGDAQYFAVTGTQVVCWPTTGPIRGTYYEEIPALASNSTNWLLTKYPDLYLFGSLTEAAIWLDDDANLAKWADRTAALIDSVRRADDRDSFDGGVLAVRAR